MTGGSWVSAHPIGEEQRSGVDDDRTSGSYSLLDGHLEITRGFGTQPEIVSSLPKGSEVTSNRVLIVEDEFLIAEVLSAMIEDMGLQVRGNSGQ